MKFLKMHFKKIVITIVLILTLIISLFYFYLSNNQVEAKKFEVDEDLVTLATKHDLLTEDQIKVINDLSLPVARSSGANYQYQTVRNYCGRINLNNGYVNHPVYQADNDNYYLNHDGNGNYTYLGSFFISQYDSCDYQGIVTTIYAHSVFLNDGSMLMATSVRLYGDPGYFSSHPYMDITTRNGQQIRAKVFAFLRLNTNQANANDYYVANDAVSFYNFIASRAINFSPTAVDSSSRIVMISTCYAINSAERYILYGVF